MKFRIYNGKDGKYDLSAYIGAGGLSAQIASCGNGELSFSGGYINYRADDEFLVSSLEKTAADTKKSIETVKKACDTACRKPENGLLYLLVSEAVMLSENAGFSPENDREDLTKAITAVRSLIIKILFSCGISDGDVSGYENTDTAEICREFSDYIGRRENAGDVSPAVCLLFLKFVSVRFS